MRLEADTLKLVNAANGLGDDIHLLVAGSDCAAVATEASRIQCVAKVLLADYDVYRHHLAENLADLVIELGAKYEHILAATSSVGKNFMPRDAALLDVAQISDIIRGESANTFVRPIYAGNTVAIVQLLIASKF